MVLACRRLKLLPMTSFPGREFTVSLHLRGINSLALVWLPRLVIVRPEATEIVEPGMSKGIFGGMPGKNVNENSLILKQ